MYGFNIISLYKICYPNGLQITILTCSIEDRKTWSAFSKYLIAELPKALSLNISTLDTERPSLYRQYRAFACPAHSGWRSLPSTIQEPYWGALGSR